jgi:hypothetical protein
LASGLAKAAFLVTTESMLRKIFKPVWFLLALLFLLEAWLWDLFVPPIRALIERIGWQHIKERLGLWLVSLPHWLIVLIFVLPDTILFPVKLGGLWLVARGHVVIGTGIFVAAKTLSLGITVLLFELCRARLLELLWFRWIYEKIEAARLWAQTQTEPIKRELRDLIQNLRSRLAPTRSHILRMMERLRDKMRRKRS